MKKGTSYLVHCSATYVGGAESSLLTEIESGTNKNIAFLLPDKGSLSLKIEEMGYCVYFLKWPELVNGFHQRGSAFSWIRAVFFPYYLWSFIKYWRELARIKKEYDMIWSSGIKSHCLLLPLLPFWKGKVVYNIRDFIHPVWLRKVISIMSKINQVEVVANSKAVGKAFGSARVQYPKIAMQNKKVIKNKGKIIISHVAYYAPYKGQDIFLRYAAEILSQGHQAEFWLIGDVLYQGKSYLEYKNNLMNLIEELGIKKHVKIIGQVNDVYSYLEKSHYLFHSTREPEPFGRVVLEALSCGCKVLCHEESGVCEVLKIDKKNTQKDVLGIKPWEQQHVFVALK